MSNNLIDKIFNNSIYTLLFFTCISFIIFIFSYDNGMFWDNVLFASKMGNNFYTTSLTNWYLPDSFDPGHPPTLGFLLAITWKLFGHTLWVSHLLMIPFTIGLFYQIHKFISFYFKDNLIILFGFILVFADPTLFTQLLIVNPEVIQLFFFFLAINSILYNNYYLKIIALFFLSIISLRGMMLCAGVFLFEFLNNLIINKQKIKQLFNKRFIFSYLIGSIPALTFLFIRYLKKRWIFSNPNSNWSEHWQIVSFNDFIKNILVLGHRYIDFGRIFILLFIVFSVINLKKTIIIKPVKQLFLISITSVFVVIVVSLFAKNPFGHRYFIASYIALTLLAFLIIEHFYKNKKIIYTLLLVGLITGNFWIYPRNISQGWDASLAHIPYYKLRDEAIDYLDKKNIQIENVATFFPNSTKIDNVDLSGDLRSFSNFDFKNEYVFFSNVYNLSDEQYDSLDNNYNAIKQFKNKAVYITIYKLKEL